MHSLRRAQEGFGIVVVALLFTAFAVVAAAALDRNTTQLEQNRQRQAEAQLTRLSLALAKYARYNDQRLPCPASRLLAPTDGNFGSATNPCSGTGAAPTGTVIAGSSGNRLLIGMVPVKDLVAYGVSYNDAFDPWGSRIVYAVHRSLTPGTTNAEVGAADMSERAEVKDYLTGETLAAPDTVLISLGKDRVGGRLRSGATIGCTGAARRIENCDDDREFLRGPLMISTRLTDTMYFDDSVSALRYTVGTSGGGCAGTIDNGYCFYGLSGNGLSCDGVCATHGGCNLTGTTYAASNNTVCRDLIDRVGNLDSYHGDATFSPGAGCFWTGTGDASRDTAPVTCAATINSISSFKYRICACNN